MLRFALLASVAFLPAVAAAEPVTIRILHVNDLDRAEASADGRGGFALLAAALAAEREGADAVIVTHGGDAISPSLLSGFDHGAHIIDLMNQAGIDIFVPGNHEFDYGPDVAKERFAQATFPIVASNIHEADGAAMAGTSETFTMELAGYTIGFIGLTTPDTVNLSSPGNLTFADPVETATRLAAQLREAGADLVFALSHLDINEDLALERSHAVDMVLGGHDHLLTVLYDGQSAVIEAKSQADYVMAVDLTVDTVTANDQQRVVWTPTFRTLDTKAYTPDPALTAAVQTYMDKLAAELDVDIGTTATALDSRRASVRGSETAIGNLIADAMRAAVDAEVAITNGGGIRADRQYDPGTMLTRRDVLSELPFGNRTVKLEVTGEDIVAALENGFSQVEQTAGRFPQVSGLVVEADLTQPPGSRVISVTVDGQPIDAARTYTLATNDFMAGGGDGYRVFVGKTALVDGLGGELMASQVMDYIAAAGSVSPAVEGRIVTAR